LNKDFIFSIDEIVLYQFTLPAAPFVAKNKEKISIKKIFKQASKLLEKCDILIIEGAGGLMVPIKKNYFMIDLIQEFQKNFNAQAILITPSNLGTINDTMLSIEALQHRKIKYKWYINLYKDKESFKTVTLPFYKEYFDKISFL